MRIWWCLNGPLAFLPIHAAGIYDRPKPGIASTLSEFAISSYTPTVRALVDSVKILRESDKGKSGLFMISQPDTPHLPRIPGTTEEIDRVEQKLTSRDVQILRLDSAAATVDRGIANMKAYRCIHFACHAQQNTEKPLQSGFSLYDGRLELSSIIQQRLVGADLAFLSACQTSAGDEKLSEEAVHLAAGMLAAGYRGVVATMWSIRDKYGPIIAEDFYSNLTEDSECLSGEYAARALHHATQNLRKSLGDSESGLLIWVPYVHFGL
jgi:CHAT domain-containing protein